MMAGSNQHHPDKFRRVKVKYSEWSLAHWSMEWGNLTCTLRTLLSAFRTECVWLVLCGEVCKKVIKTWFWGATRVTNMYCACLSHFNFCPLSRICWPGRWLVEESFSCLWNAWTFSHACRGWKSQSWVTSRASVWLGHIPARWGINCISRFCATARGVYKKNKQW